MKNNEKEQVRNLRKNDGLALNEIAKRIGVAKSSVCRWVKDIKLTEEQEQKLKEQNPAFKRVLTGSRAWSSKFRDLRQQYQEEGRVKARENNPLHLTGCMLYWCEGAKSRNALKFANSELPMHQLFLKFLKECYNVKIEDITITINCYLDEGKTYEDIKKYWLDGLGLNELFLRKGQINNKPNSSKLKRVGMCPYGTCYLKVNKSTEILQNIYGSIQEYGQFKNTNWIE